METIKKFKNRKLYSTKSSKYITLQDIISKVKNSEQFQVVEHDSNLDITSKILKQALVNVNIPNSEVVRLLING